MDVAAAGQAAAQVSTAQRAQQASISGLRSSQLQAQSLAAVLAQSAASGNTTANAVQPTPPTNTGGGGPQSQGSGNPGSGGGNTNATRGSLVNILV